MNERIKQATGYSGNYWNNGGPGCSASLGNCVGTPTTNRAATDVTADIESLFGTIPAECRTDSQVPPFSNFPGYPTTAVISTFSGGPVAPPTGFSTVNGNGWTESGGVARPTTTVSVIRTNTSYDADQEAYCTLETLPAFDEGTSTFAINFLIVDSGTRYKVSALRNTGTDNDSMTVIRRVSGVDTTLSSTNLGFDMATGDAVGIRVDDGVITAAYKRALDGVWKIIATANTLPTDPSSGYIGMGAATASCTEFGGGNLNTSPGDTTPPSAPTGLAVTSVPAGNVVLGWTASTDNIAVTGYRAYRGEQSDCSDCVQVGTSTVTVFTDTAPPPGVTRYYRVTAVDAASNESTASNITPARIPDGPAYTETSGRIR